MKKDTNKPKQNDRKALFSSGGAIYWHGTRKKLIRLQLTNLCGYPQNVQPAIIMSTGAWWHMFNVK